MVTTVKNNDLSQAKKSKIAVVDFSATWCGPCRMTAPIMEELSEELKGQVDFFNCDVDENNSLAAEFGISSIPAIAVLKNGVLSDMTVGFRPKAALKDFILGGK